MGCEWAICWLKCISPPEAPNSSNQNSNWISFILFSTSNLHLLSKFFNCSEMYNANWSPASFGLSKTSMHFAINFCFCSVGSTPLRLALFSIRDIYWNLNSTSRFTPNLPARSLLRWLIVGLEVLKLRYFWLYFDLFDEAHFSHERPVLINVVSTLVKSLPCCALREFHLDLIVFISMPNSSLISERAYSITSLLE